MNNRLLRSYIKALIAESISEDLGAGGLEYIRSTIDRLGERLGHNHEDIIKHLRLKLDRLGDLRFEEGSGSDWVDFRERLAQAVADLGVDWGTAQNLTIWARDVLPFARGAGAPRRPAPPPAPAEAPFQRWAFSPQRPGDVPREPNTALETRIIKALRGHFIRNVPVPAELVRTMIDLVDAGLYTDILRKPPTGATLYRGLDANDDFIRSLGLDPEGDPSGQHDIRLRIEPGRKGRSSSWSYDPTIAELFAGSGDFSSGGRWAVVLRADADDNPSGFLDGESFLNNLSTFSGENRPMRDESECIGVGRILLSGVEISERL